MIVIKEFIFIALSFELAKAKQYELCEFATEIFETHKVPRDEIYKHLCIVKILHTSMRNGDFVGIYALGSQWWCGQESPGGRCNVTCSDLLDDDIADDVQCANLILKEQGLKGWNLNENVCRIAFQDSTNECLAELDAINAVYNSTEASISAPSTIGAKSTSTERITISTFLPSTVQTTQKTSLKHETFAEDAQTNSASSTTVITTIALVLLVVLIVVVVYYQRINNIVKAPPIDEYENVLIL